jgi:hypothetical protein
MGLDEQARIRSRRRSGRVHDHDGPDGAPTDPTHGTTGSANRRVRPTAATRAHPHRTSRAPSSLPTSRGVELWPTWQVTRWRRSPTRSSVASGGSGAPTGWPTRSCGIAACRCGGHVTEPKRPLADRLPPGHAAVACGSGGSSRRGCGLRGPLRDGPAHRCDRARSDAVGVHRAGRDGRRPAGPAQQPGGDRGDRDQAGRIPEHGRQLLAAVAVATAVATEATSSRTSAQRDEDAAATPSSMAKSMFHTFVLFSDLR